MKKTSNNALPLRRDPGLALMQNDAAQKAFMEKMRGKLARPSEKHIIREEAIRVRTQKEALGWGWKLAMAGILLVANTAYLEYRHEASKPVVKLHAPTLSAPAKTLDVNDQALYWTYAMYDFKLLKQKFDVPKNVVINGRQAAMELAQLLPRVDVRTHFIIDRYLPVRKIGGKP